MGILENLQIKLNLTALQKSDQKLYDFLNDLISVNSTLSKSVAAIAAATSDGGGNSTTKITNIQQFLDFIGDSDGSGDSIPIPGPPGAAGSAGATGAAGITTTIVFQEDTISESDSLIPGPIGPQGLQGIQGLQGLFGIPGEDGLPGEDSIIPGSAGPTGSIGATGPQGSQGIPLIDALDGEDGFIPGPTGIQGVQGDKGELPMFFSTSTVDSAPGNGFFRYDNSNPTSATQIFISNATFPGLDISGFVDTWDDSSNLSDRGYLTIRVNDNNSNVVNIFRIIGTTIVGGGYRKIQVLNVVSGGIRPQNNQLCAIAFNRTGDLGPQGPQGPLSFEYEIPDEPLMVPGPVGPVATMVEFSQDLGSGESSGTFDLAGLSGLTTNADVEVVQTAQPIASKGNARDEFEMDAIQLTGYVLNSTTIRVYWWSPSVVVGTYNFAFAISPGAINISGTGRIAQLPVSLLSSAVATGSGRIPLDDTIPQITEGDEYMVAPPFIPVNALSTLVIQVVVCGASSAASSNCFALFQDAIANALAAVVMSHIPTANAFTVGSMTYTMIAGTTSPITFRVRAATNSGTFTFNGFAAGRIFGAIPKSSIVITEYLP